MLLDRLHLRTKYIAGREKVKNKHNHDTGENVAEDAQRYQMKVFERM